MDANLHLDLHRLRTEELARDAGRRREVAERRADARRATAPAASRRARRDRRSRTGGAGAWGLPAGTPRASA